jgi:hypothetical protein
MALNNLSQDDQRKLNEFMDAGLRILQDQADLREGLSEKAKDLATHLDIKPGLLMKSLRSAFKQTLAADKEVMEGVEDILEITGHA